MNAKVRANVQIFVNMCVLRLIKTKLHCPKMKEIRVSVLLSGLLWFFKLHSLQQTLKTEVVGVAVDWRLVGT